ncbi:MAG: hypothetical protein ABSB88_02445 [Bryobacteraceae bacterium]|jgi:hypothetical protein
MLSLNALAEEIAAYRDRRIDAADFEDWFRHNSWGYYDRQGEPLSDAIAAVDVLLSSFEFGEIGEDELRLELATANRAFASSVEIRPVVSRLVWIPICEDDPQLPESTRTSSVLYPVDHLPHERLGTLMRAPVAACVVVALGILAVPDADRGPLSSALTVEFPVVAPSV